MVDKKSIYAGFWLRFIAHVIDSLILISVGYAIQSLIGLFFGDLLSYNISNDGVEGWHLMRMIVFSIVITTILHWTYYAGMESSRKQATLGKMALKLKVTDLKGKPISFLRASGRFFGSYLSGLILGIGYFMIGFTEKKQGLHDILAGCLVVKK